MVVFCSQLLNAATDLVATMMTAKRMLIFLLVLFADDAFCSSLTCCLRVFTRVKRKLNLGYLRKHEQINGSFYMRTRFSQKRSRDWARFRCSFCCMNRNNHHSPFSFPRYRHIKRTTSPYIYLFAFIKT
jgi:hypothetical protein